MAGVIGRVAMVSMQPSPTAHQIAAELARRGVEVDLLTRATGTPAVTEVLEGMHLHELAAGEPGPLPSHRLGEVTDEFGEAVAALARRDSRGYELIHAHFWLSGIACLPVAIELGIPLVQSFHSLAAMTTVAGAEEPLIRVRSEMFVANQADALIASSSAEATALIDDVGAAADRTWIVPLGVDLDLFTPRGDEAHAEIRRELGLEPDRALVVLAARIVPVKGHELAVRAIAELQAMRGWSPVLVIAGEVEPGQEGFQAELGALASELGIAHSVRFVGALGRGQLAALLSAAVVTLVPSFTETFGLVALESAAAGTPVLGFRAGGLAESIEDGTSGFLLGTRDPRYWATEIAIMIENDERRVALELTARAHAERFSWGTAAASLMGVYAGVGRP